MTLVIERFIAMAICWVSRVPDAPTIMPATMSAGLFSATPVAAALRPVKALSSEMTTGMSAPPIGRTSRLPRAAAATSSRMIKPSECEPATIATPHPIATRPSSALTGVCSAPIVTGLPEISSCSFANAMFEPQKETEPMIAAKQEKIAT